VISISLEEYNEAKKLIENYISRFGKSGPILLQLAKIQNIEHNTVAFEKTLLESLNMDPNQNEGIEYLLTLKKRESEEEIFQQLAKIENSWLPQLKIISYKLNNTKRDITKLKAVMPMIQKLLPKSTDCDPILEGISKILENGGFIKECIDLIRPLYNPNKHSADIGFCLLRCYIEMNDEKNGRILYNQMELPLQKSSTDYALLLLYLDKLEILDFVGITKETEKTVIKGKDKTELIDEHPDFHLYATLKSGNK